MPAYTYTGDEDRYYPTLGLTPVPGESYDLDRNPGDGRFDPPDPEPVKATEPEEATTAAAGASTAAKKKGS